MMRPLLFASLAGVLLAGCPRGGCPTQPHTDPLRVLNSHRSMHRTVRVLRGEARVDQRGSEGRIRGTILMYLERPDRVRFDAMTQLGPAAVLTSDGEDFQLLDMRENRFVEGPTCPSNIARLLGVQVSGEELTRFLFGDSPRLQTDDVTLACGEEGYLITLTADDGRRQELSYAVRPFDLEAAPSEQHLRLRRSELFAADGSTEWRATYDDYRVITDPADEQGRGVAIPFRVRFEDPSREADTLVKVKELEIVTEAPAPEVFSQTPPPGITVESAVCE